MIPITHRPPLEEFMQQGPYVGYSYSYPHKTTYRPLQSPRSLESVWKQESTDSLFLYVHIPFCEFRCGFCNLFTFSQPEHDLPTQYLRTLRRQAEAIREQIPNAKFGRVAIGGGTPSFLDAMQLQELFDILEEWMEIERDSVPISFEVSPGTLDAVKLKLLRESGVDRISMGIQSLDQRDVSSLGRPQKGSDVYRAIDLIRESPFETLNLDLIYGAENQTLDSWTETLGKTIRIQPEEVYIYPLYVRPLTGLAKSNRPASDRRLEFYRAARNLLNDSGYEQVSMRMFQRSKRAAKLAQDYSCQRDGMIGLGCGARSYTSNLHYGSSYAVKQSSILRLIQSYNAQTSTQLRLATHGMELNQDEQKRRYVILSLLLVEGLDCQGYTERFGDEIMSDFNELNQLCDLDMAEISDGRFQLTTKGIEWSDTIGPWLYSSDVRLRMGEFPWID